MSQTCSTEQCEEKCGTCGSHNKAMVMLMFIVLAAIGLGAAVFLG